MTQQYADSSVCKSRTLFVPFERKAQNQEQGIVNVSLFGVDSASFSAAGCSILLN